MIMKRLASMILLAIMLPLGAANISMERIFAPNLLKNADFSIKNTQGMPQHWYFDNCSKAAFTFRSDIGGIVIESPGQKYGYFLQLVQVQEGVRYCIRAKIRAYRTFANIWLSCSEYNDGGSPLGHYPVSQTTFFILAYPHQGRSAKAILDKFIDPDLVSGVNADTWTTYTREFTPPTGKGIKTYAIRCGCFGGYKGWVNYTDVYFGQAASNLQITVNTNNWSSIVIKDKNGQEYFRQNKTDRQNFTVTLPTQSVDYILTLTLSDGKTENYEVPNE